MSEADGISARQVRVAVNCGDHGQDITRTVEVDPAETVRSMMERLIPKGTKYIPRDYDNYVVLQFVEPIEPPDPPSNYEGDLF